MRFILALQNLESPERTGQHDQLASSFSQTLCVSTFSASVC